MDISSLNKEYTRDILSGLVGQESFSSTVAEWLEQSPESDKLPFINFSLDVLNDNAYWLTDLVIKTLANLLTLLDQSAVKPLIKAHVASRYLTSSSIGFEIASKRCHLDERRWLEKTLKSNPDDYFRVTTSEFHPISCENFLLGLFAQTHTILGEHLNPVNTLQGIVFFDQNFDSLSLALFFVVILDRFVWYNEPLLLKAVSLSTHLSQLVLPQDLENPQPFFEASNHLSCIQTPSRCYMRESKSPENLVKPNEDIVRQNYDLLSGGSFLC